MSSRIPIVVASFAVVCLLVGGRAADGGAIWLQSGRVVQGEVTKAGQVYVVTNEAGRHVFPVPGVLLTGESVVDLYRQLAATHRSVEDRQKLAEWCLDNGLQAQALEQLRSLGSAAKADPTIAELFRRAETLVPVEPSPENPVDPRERAYGLSRGTITHYRSRVAPLLKNGCGSSRCHGPITSRPLAFAGTARPDDIRYVLGETLRFLDPLNPAGSPLVHRAFERHGGSKAAPLSGRHLDQQREILLEFASAAAAEMRLTDDASVASSKRD